MAKMTERIGSSYVSERIQEVGDVGLLDYVKDGVLYKQASADAVMITSSDELDTIVENYSPGAVAYTAGFEHMWQLDASGTWTSII